jgi:two-component system NtrC family sensor kinase
MVTIRVCDNGKGISEEALENIFDPFYTTKEPGKGTGLGLAVSLTLIEQMGGTLTAESLIEKGTTMIIALPRSNEAS